MDVGVGLGGELFLPTTTTVPLELGQEPGSLQVFGRAPPGVGSPSESIGACPFSQRVYIALEERGLPYVVTCIDEDDIPPWLTNIKKDLDLPALRDGDEWIFGADEINGHLNERYSKESRPFIIPDDMKPRVDKLTSDLLGTFLKWLESKDVESKAGKEYEHAIRELNAQLETKGPYLNGEFHSDADFRLAPILHHARVALLHYMNFRIPKIYASVLTYTELLEGRSSFKKTNPQDELVLEVWGKKFGLELQRQ